MVTVFKSISPKLPSKHYVIDQGLKSGAVACLYFNVPFDEGGGGDLCPLSLS